MIRRKGSKYQGFLPPQAAAPLAERRGREKNAVDGG